ncbi:hypothetical protein DVA76_18215, partial [Acinetobacter baumannii]
YMFCTFAGSSEGDKGRHSTDDPGQTEKDGADKAFSESKQSKFSVVVLCGCMYKKSLLVCFIFL